MGLKEISDGFGDNEKCKCGTRWTLWVFCLSRCFWGPWVSSSWFWARLFLSQVPDLTGFPMFPIWLEDQALGSVPRFHAGSCWQFSLQLPICLEFFPRFHSGNYWWQSQLPTGWDSLYFMMDSLQSLFFGVCWFPKSSDFTLGTVGGYWPELNWVWLKKWTGSRVIVGLT